MFLDLNLIKDVVFKYLVNLIELDIMRYEEILGGMGLFLYW